MGNEACRYIYTGVKNATELDGTREHVVHIYDRMKPDCLFVLLCSVLVEAMELVGKGGNRLSLIRGSNEMRARGSVVLRCVDMI